MWNIDSIYSFSKSSLGWVKGEMDFFAVHDALRQLWGSLCHRILTKTIPVLPKAASRPSFSLLPPTPTPHFQAQWIKKLDRIQLNVVESSPNPKFNTVLKKSAVLRRETA